MVNQFAGIYRDLCPENVTMCYVILLEAGTVKCILHKATFYDAWTHQTEMHLNKNPG